MVRRTGLPGGVPRRALDRGDLAPGADPKVVRRLLVGAIALAPVYGGAPTPPREVARIVAAGLPAAVEGDVG